MIRVIQILEKENKTHDMLNKTHDKNKIDDHLMSMKNIILIIPRGLDNLIINRISRIIINRINRINKIFVSAVFFMKIIYFPYIIF